MGRSSSGISIEKLPKNVKNDIFEWSQGQLRVNTSIYVRWYPSGGTDEKQQMWYMNRFSTRCLLRYCCVVEYELMRQEHVLFFDVVH